MWFFGNIEGFVNETQARSDIITTFITISIIFFGMVIAFLLLWAYNKSDKLFFMIFCGMVALYAITMGTFIAIIRSNITSNQFKIFMITSTFMAILSIFILILFVVKSSYLFKNIDVSNKRSPERRIMPTPVYVPENINSYNQEPVEEMNDEYNDYMQPEEPRSPRDETERY
jgi:glucan phosphoethanolaminetransferase (alkaline phosphatase superfamily)